MSFLCPLLLYNYWCNVCHIILSAIVCDNPIISLLIILLSPLIGNPINLQALFKGYTGIDFGTERPLEP